MVLNYLVSDGSLILDPVKVKNKVDDIMEGWTKKKAMLKNYVDNNAFSGVIDAISLDDLTCVIKNLLDGKAAGLSGISNELWKHCDGSVLGLLLDLLNICLVCELTVHKILSKLLSDRILSVCGLFNIFCEDNFSVLKGTTTQSPIFTIGSIVEDTLKKDHKLWLVLQDMRKAYNSAMDVCSSGAVSRLGQCLSSVNLRVVNVYTDGSLRDLGSCEMKCGTAAYFSDLNQSIGAKQCGIINLIRRKWLDVSWHKVKEHLGIVNNKCVDKLASLAANSSLALSVLVMERFIKTGKVAVFRNICHFAHKIFRSVNYACWEVGLGFDVIDDSLLSDVNWFCIASVWHPDFHMATSFTSKFMASLHSYFLKAFYCYLPVTVQKHLYSKIYLSVSCLHCGEVESSDHSFVCMFDSDVRKSILRFHLAKWHCVSELGLHLSHVSQMLSLCTSDDVLYTTVSKDFVFKDWVQKALFILGDAKIAEKFIVDFVYELSAAHHMDIWLVRAKYRALIEKDGLIPLDGSVYPVTCGLSCMFFAEVIRLLGIAETVGVCFGFYKHCCFSSGIDSMVSVLIDS
ncbi:hypothetical protein G9A89_001213 [Geosiphon pyriformis]|nr:hypothetical protein G9A89_001213 [Geosiphon pyriformis]